MARAAIALRGLVRGDAELYSVRKLGDREGEAESEGTGAGPGVTGGGGDNCPETMTFGSF